MMRFIKVTNLRYANSECTAITCDVQFEGFDASIPFTATYDDVEQHGRDIFDKCKAGIYGEISPYESPGGEYFQNIAMSIRDEYLVHSDNITEDWRLELQLGTIDNDDKKKLIAWIQYNKFLKAMTFNDVYSEADIKSIVWPTQPGA